MNTPSPWLLVAGLATSPIPAASPATQEVLLRPAGGAAEITAADLEAVVRTLAADELLGRRTGEPGSVLAGEYLARALEEAGLKPGGDDGTFRQRVPYRNLEYSSMPVLRLQGSDGQESEPVYGVAFDQFAGLPLAGRKRVVRVGEDTELPGTTGGPDVTVALFLDGSRSERKDWLESLGTPEGEGWGLIVTRGSSRDGRGPLERLPRSRPNGSLVPTIAVRGELLERFQRGEVESLSLEVEAEVAELEVFNVIGVIPGLGTSESRELARETIVFSAHYDHIGARAPAAGQGSEPVDTIFNGADDDASGCAAVVELAAAFASAAPPARTLVFLLATGEEIGLVGTNHYIEHPLRPLEDTVLNLNFEMIGRPDALVGGAGKMWLTGYELSNLGELFAEAQLSVLPDPRPAQNFFRRSDNWAFARLGIVAQSLSTYDAENHHDYHQVGDEADRLDYEHMQDCVRAAYLGARFFADGARRPEWLPGGNPAGD